MKCSLHGVVKKTRNKIRREKKMTSKEKHEQNLRQNTSLVPKDRSRSRLSYALFRCIRSFWWIRKAVVGVDTKYSLKSHWFDRFGGALASYMDVYVFHRSLKKLIIVHTISTSVARPYKENNCLLHSMLKQLSWASIHICSIQYLCTWFSSFKQYLSCIVPIQFIVFFFHF